MNLVSNYTIIIEAYNFVKSFKKSILTNCYLNESKLKKLIENKLLYEFLIDETTFLLKKNKTFYNLYYYTSSINQLQTSLKSLMIIMKNEIIVVDLVSKRKNFDELLIFQSNNFFIYNSLVRMFKINNTEQDNLSGSIKVRNADLEDCIIVDDLLNKYFDHKSEQIPDYDDLVNWVNNDNIIVYENESCILGFIIYEFKNSILYLRYWFVHPNYRNMKVGSELFKEFLFRGNAAKREIFWVIESNSNAIKRYIHYGFKAENMYNYVLTNKKIKYEK